MSKNISKKFSGGADPTQRRRRPNSATARTLLSDGADKTQNINGICRNITGIFENINDILSFVRTAAEFDGLTSGVSGADERSFLGRRVEPFGQTSGVWWAENGLASLFF